jgi:hypothetical protein
VLSTWISVVGTAIALVALALSFRAQQTAGAQFRTAQMGTGRERMTALIQQLVQAVNRAGVAQSQPWPPTADSAAALVELEASANALADFLEAEDNQTLDPGWLALCALAWAFANSWNIQRSEKYWALAVSATDRTPDTRAASYVRATRAQFLYSVDRPGDVEQARSDLEAARRAIDADDRNIAPSVQQKILLLVSQAQYEVVCGHTKEAVDRIGDAVALTESLTATWRRRQVTQAIAGFVLTNAGVINPETYQLSEELREACGQQMQEYTQRAQMQSQMQPVFRPWPPGSPLPDATG